MAKKKERKRPLKAGLNLKVIQNPTQNPKEPGITRIQGGAFEFCYPTFVKDGVPCKPWVRKPTWTYEGGDRLTGEVVEAFEFIEPEARILAESVVRDHKKRADKKAEKEKLNPRLSGFPNGAT